MRRLHPAARAALLARLTALEGERAAARLRRIQAWAARQIELAICGREAPPSVGRSLAYVALFGMYSQRDMARWTERGRRLAPRCARRGA